MPEDDGVTETEQYFRDNNIDGAAVVTGQGGEDGPVETEERSLDNFDDDGGSSSPGPEPPSSPAPDPPDPDPAEPDPAPPDTGAGGIPTGGSVGNQGTSTDEQTSTSPTPAPSEPEPEPESEPAPDPPDTGPAGVPQDRRTGTPTADPAPGESGSSSSSPSSGSSEDSSPQSPPAESEPSTSTPQSDTSQDTTSPPASSDNSQSNDSGGSSSDEQTPTEQYLEENNIDADGDIDPGGRDNLDDPGSVVRLDDGRVVSEDRFRTLRDGVEQIQEANPDSDVDSVDDITLGENEDGQRVFEPSTEFTEEQYADAVEDQPGVDEDVNSDDVLQSDDGPTLDPETEDAVEIDVIENAAVEQANEQLNSEVTDDDVSVSDGDPELTLEAQREEIAAREGVDVEDVTLESGGDFTIEQPDQPPEQPAADTGDDGAPSSSASVAIGSDAFLRQSTSEVRQNAADRLGTDPSNVRFEEQNGQTVATVGQPRQQSPIESVSGENTPLDTDARVGETEMPDDVQLSDEIQSSGQVTDAPTAGEVEASEDGFGEFVDDTGEFVADVPDIVQRESFRASQAVQSDIVNPAAEGFGGAVGDVTGSRVAGTATTKFSKGVGDIATGTLALPGVGVTAGEVGVGAVEFTAEQISEDGVVEGSATSAQTGAGVAANFAGEQVNQIVNNPIRATGGFAAGLGVGKALGQSSRLTSGKTGKVMKYTDARTYYRGGKKAVGKARSRLRNDVDGDGLDVGQPADMLLDADAVDNARDVSGPSATSRVRGELDRITGRQQTSPSELVDDQAAMGPVQTTPDVDTPDTRTFESPETRDPTRPDDVGGTFEDVRQDSLTQTQDALDDVARRERAATERSVDPDTDPVSGRPSRTIDQDGIQRDRFGDRVTEPERTTTPTQRTTPAGQTGVAGAVTDGAQQRQERAQRQEVTAGPATPDGVSEDTTLPPVADDGTVGGGLLDEETRQDVTAPTVGDVTAPSVTDGIDTDVGQTPFTGTRPFVDQPTDFRQPQRTRPFVTPEETERTPLTTPETTPETTPDDTPPSDPDPNNPTSPPGDPGGPPRPPGEGDPRVPTDFPFDDDEDEEEFGSTDLSSVRFKNPIASGRDVLF